MLHMIQKQLLPLFLALSMTGACLAGCGNSSSEQAPSDPSGAEAETENSGETETEETPEEAEEAEEDYLSDIPEEERARLKNAAASDETWTVMLYLAGSDLEEDGRASDNLREIMAAEPTPSVNVFIQTGGAAEWKCDGLGVEIDPTVIQRYTYDENGFTLVDEQEQANMADPGTLTSFIQFCRENSDTDHYILTLWDHGGGTAGGLIMDENYPGSETMSLPELGTALADANVHFDAVITDMCLMSSLETCRAIQDHADYLIASEEEMPGAGADYTNWLQYLYTYPGTSTVDFGRYFCDFLVNKYNLTGDDLEKSTLTCSVIDLASVDAVEEAFNSFFGAINTSISNVDEMYNFTSYINYTDTFSYGDRYMCGMVDLKDFAYLTKEAGYAVKEAEALMDAVDEAVPYHVAGSEHAVSGGMSFWFCPESADPARFDTLAEVTDSAEYLAFYDSISEQWDAPDWVYEEIAAPSVIRPEDYAVDYELGYNEDGLPQIVITNGFDSLIRINPVLHIPKEEAENGYMMIGSDFALNFGSEENSYAVSFDGTTEGIGGVYAALDFCNETQEEIYYNIPVRINCKDGTAEDIYVRAVYRYDTPLYDQYDTSDEGLDLSGHYEILGIYGASSTPGMPARVTMTMEDVINHPNLNTLNMLWPDSAYGLFDIDKAFESYYDIELSDDMQIENYYLEPGEYAYTFEIYNCLGQRTYTDYVPFLYNEDGTCTPLVYE